VRNFACSISTIARFNADNEGDAHVILSARVEASKQLVLADAASAVGGADAVSGA
jgi:hypothetical protein